MFLRLPTYLPRRSNSASGLRFALAASIFAVSQFMMLPQAQAQQTPGPTITDGKPLPEKIRLHNGWNITPVGSHEKLEDVPEAFALSPDGKTIAVTTGGSGKHTLNLVDTESGKIRQALPLVRAQSSGIVWSPDSSMLYVAGGNSGQIFVFKVETVGQRRATEQTALDVPELAIIGSRTVAAPGSTDKQKFNAPAYLWGLALSSDSKTLYVTNLSNDSLYALDAATGALKGKITFARESRPGALRLSPDGKILLVAGMGANALYMIDSGNNSRLNTGTARVEDAGTEVRTIKTGKLPTSLALTRDGSRLFVTCANSDSVSVVDTRSALVIEEISLRLTPKAPVGASPSSLALSSDEQSLYVTCADNNAVAVIDVAVPLQSRVRGFIPTAHYPTVVAALPDSRRLLIGCAKGFGFGPNNRTDGKPINPVAPMGYPYIMNLMKGVLSVIDLPDERKLAGYTRQVYANSPYKSDSLLERPLRSPRPGSNPVPSRIGDPSPIKHILYIIKENRTYDQVLGDMTDARGRKQGNGDPSLCLFNEEVTPNHHALAREYVLLDNLYANGEVSVDGHHWSNAAFVPDFMERTWPAQYGGKGAPPIRYGDFGDPLAETPGGRIWDLCARKGIPYSTYYYHVDKNRSDAWSEARGRGERDYIAADIFINDLQKWEIGGEMPGFVVMALSEDHTAGTRPGAFTPRAAVASNDFALGKIVAACSKSRFWKEMAIFVIEDDAQNGPDHVDAHRTVGLAISPYTRQGGKTDSTFYTTVSMLRTMELILGLPPMSQYDAAATPMYSSFRNQPDMTPYTVRAPRIDLNAKNTAQSFGAKRSLAFDFSAPDRLSLADENDLNRILWHSIKGVATPYPALVRRPIFTGAGTPLHSHAKRSQSGDDDDD
jgi:YVTN family beta-propeller protein